MSADEPFLVEPYAYVRTITLGLGTIWTLGSILRTWRFHCRWRDRLEPLGFERPWLRLQIRTFILRITVLDPVNLALILFLFGIWAFRWWLELRLEG